MLERLRTSFLPRIEPELRHSRIRIARTLGKVYFSLVALWAAGLVIHRLATRGAFPRIEFDVFGVILLGAIGWVAWWLLNQGRLLPAGYLLAGSIFLLVGVAVSIRPDFVYLISFGFLFSILFSGAIIGADVPYLFSVGAFLLTSATIYRAQGLPAFDLFQFQGLLNWVYIFGFASLTVTISLILRALASQVQRTVGSLHRQAEQMAKLAHTDPLTGLANRRFLFEQLESEFARAKRYRRPFTLLFIDLDGFKTINDQFGHLFGDEILRGSAMALQAVLRTTDLLARIGGDEFAVLLPETSIEGGRNVTEKLRKALVAYSKQLSSVVPILTFSVGVSQISKQDEAIEDILARADKAQYLAKTTGKAMTRTDQDLALESQNEMTVIDEPSK